MNEFDPRNYTGVVDFDDGEWDTAGEMIDQNDFVMAATYRVGPGVRETLSWATSAVQRQRLQAALGAQHERGPSSATGRLLLRVACGGSVGLLLPAVRSGQSTGILDRSHWFGLELCHRCIAVDALGTDGASGSQPLVAPLGQQARFVYRRAAAASAAALMPWTYSEPRNVARRSSSLSPAATLSITASASP